MRLLRERWQRGLTRGSGAKEIGGEYRILLIAAAVTISALIFTVGHRDVANLLRAREGLRVGEGYAPDSLRDSNLCF